MAVIVVACWWKPSLAGAVSAPAPLRERLRRLIDLLPPLVLFVVVMGSIYLGWATPTESAALGVMMSLLLCAVYGKLSVKMLHECFITTVSVTAMIMLIAAAAFFLNFVLGLMGVPQALADFASKLGSSQAHDDRGPDDFLPDPGLLPRCARDGDRHDSRSCSRSSPRWGSIPCGSASTSS